MGNNNPTQKLSHIHTWDRDAFTPSQITHKKNLIYLNFKRTYCSLTVYQSFLAKGIPFTNESFALKLNKDSNIMKIQRIGVWSFELIIQRIVSGTYIIIKEGTLGIIHPTLFYLGRWGLFSLVNLFYFFLSHHLNMPILEISSAQVPKDLSAFTKRLNAIFAEYIGKPESVSSYL